MAERPDLDYYVPILNSELRGREIVDFEVRKPVVMRVAVEGDAKKLTLGRRFQGAARRGHFVRFALDCAPDLEIVVAPMLAGRFAFLADKEPRDVACLWRLDDGRTLLYRDDVQMGKVYLIQLNDFAKVPGLAKIGIDVLSPAFTRDAFAAIAAKRREQIRVLLMDKSVLDSFGNAYADEVLFEARVHPKTAVNKLERETLDSLHDAMVKVLTEATQTIIAAQPPLDMKLRDFVKVRNRHGEPCPRCGTKIRRAGVRGVDTFFCPECQPETRRGSVVDWRKLSG